MHFKPGQLLLFFFSFYAILEVAHSEIVGEAKVQVLSRRIRRSESTDKVQHEYDVKVSAFGVTHDLKLQPAGSVFGPNFRYNEIRVDKNGQTVWTDITPSREKIRALEEKLYVDVTKNTVVRLEKVDGEFTLNGIVNDANIRTRRRKRMEAVTHKIVVPQSPLDGRDDYIMTDETGIEGRARSDMDENTKLKVEPELSFVVDFELSKNFTDPMALLEYMAITVNSVNNKYALTNTDMLSVVCKFVGLHSIRSEAAQPFVTAGLLSTGQYHMEAILASYLLWANQNQDLLGKHDISPLQLGVVFNETGLRGIAHTPGACQFDRLFKTGRISSATPISQDLGKYFGGAFTLTHELGHSLGCPHDGNRESRACSFDDGYIMSYKGWGTLNHFKLSPCCLAAIRKYAMTVRGKCLLENSGATIKYNSSLNPGDLVDSSQICAFYGGGTPVVVGRSADDTCRNTECMLERFDIRTADTAPGNGAPCGKSGKCRNGWCIGQGHFNLNELCAMIQNLTASKFEYTDRDDVCRTGMFKCRTKMIGTDETAQGTYRIGPGTVCREKQVCFNKRCTHLVYNNDVKTPQAKCIVRTGKDEAEVGPIVTSPNNICMAYSTCTYGGESEPYEDIPLNGTKCTAPSGDPGVCSTGVCNELSGLTLKERCGLKTGDSSADGVEEPCAITCSVGGSVVDHIPLNLRKCTAPSGDAGGCSAGVCKELRELTPKERCGLETGDPSADGVEDACAITCSVSGSVVDDIPLNLRKCTAPSGDPGGCSAGVCKELGDLTQKEQCGVKTGDPSADGVEGACAITCSVGGSMVDHIPLSLRKCTAPSGGHGGCSNGVCKELRQLTPKSQCVIQTGDPSADGDDLACAITCDVGGHPVLTLTDSKTGVTCKTGEAAGSCVKGQCVPEMMVIFPNMTTNEKMSLTTACEKLTGIVGALARETTRDEACSGLMCTKPNGKIVRSNTHTPDGTKCGPLMRCISGKCKVCGSSR